MQGELENCAICPRECHINRIAGHTGYCGYDAGYHIASIVIHGGEEPPINGSHGICNVFFKGCNLRCSYCQNYQISRPKGDNDPMSLEVVIDRITECLDHGIEAVGFVNPSHFTPHVRRIIDELHKRDYFPITVYNTNAYDHVRTLEALEGIIDVYLPDFKYMDSIPSLKFSGAGNYPSVAAAAIKEMYRQKGSTVVLNENGQAITGLIIRHLVLPGHCYDSVKILEWIASELSPSIHLSLMSQYYPTACVADDPVLGRHVTHAEYRKVLYAMERLGFYRGWIQDYDSHSNYRPDFDRMKPFG